MSRSRASGPADESRGASKDPLGRYREKRNFTRTKEPRGAGPGRRSGPAFVVQQHAARRLHYDVRLEADGVLKSWAVPKGPSDDPKDKRLAVRTEDHPVEYADFEGVIPAGEYGAGEVIVWDSGTYRNLTERRGRAVPVADAVERGHVAVWLEGRKLRGGYALTRLDHGTRRAPAGSVAPGAPGDAWLLVKIRDETACDPELARAVGTPTSVRSGRTLADVAGDPDAEKWGASGSSADG